MILGIFFCFLEKNSLSSKPNVLLLFKTGSMSANTCIESESGNEPRLSSGSKSPSDHRYSGKGRGATILLSCCCSWYRQLLGGKGDDKRLADSDSPPPPKNGLGRFSACSKNFIISCPPRLVHFNDFVVNDANMMVMMRFDFTAVRCSFSISLVWTKPWLVLL